MIKSFKKLTAFILCVLTVFSFCMGTASASDDDPEIIAQKASVALKAGSARVNENTNVSLTVCIDESDGIKAMDLDISFDASAFTFVSAEALDSDYSGASPVTIDPSNVSDGKINITWNSETAVNTAQDIAVITLTANPGYYGEHTIGFDATSTLTDLNGYEADSAFTDCTLEIYDVAELSVSLSDNITAENNEAAVYLSIDSNSGIKSLRTFISFDKNVFTVKSVEACGGFDSGSLSANAETAASDGYLSIQWDSLTDTAFTGNGQIVKIVLAVDPSAPHGSYDITLLSSAPGNDSDKTYILDSNGVDCIVTLISGSVYVKGKASFDIKYTGNTDRDGKNVVKDLEETSFVLCIGKSEGVGSFSVTISFDAEAFSLVSALPLSTVYTGLNVNESGASDGRITVTRSGPAQSEEAELVKITLKAKNNKFGNYVISCASSAELYDNSACETTDGSCSVKIIDYKSAAPVLLMLFSMWNVFADLLSFKFSRLPEDWKKMVMYIKQVF